MYMFNVSNRECLILKQKGRKLKYILNTQTVDNKKYVYTLIKLSA